MAGVMVTVMDTTVAGAVVGEVGVDTDGTGVGTRAGHGGAAGTVDMDLMVVGTANGKRNFWNFHHREASKHFQATGLEFCSYHASQVHFNR